MKKLISTLTPIQWLAVALILIGIAIMGSASRPTFGLDSVKQSLFSLETIPFNTARRTLQLLTTT